MKKDNIKVEGHKGTWYVIGKDYYSGYEVFLLEHEQYGDEVPCLIIDKDKNIIQDNVYNGFDDLE